MLWNACKQVYRMGGHSYFMNIYNALDSFMLMFYMASFALKRLTEKIVNTSFLLVSYNCFTGSGF